MTDDMKTHKNPALRSGPAPFKPPTAAKPVAAAKPAAVSKPVSKPPLVELQGKKWVVVSCCTSFNVLLGGRCSNGEEPVF